MLLMYRPLELHHLQTPRVSKLPYFTNIALTEFTPQEADKLIQLKLAQFFGPSPEVSPTLLERVTTQAEGNPFYIEELLNFLRDKGIDPTDNQALEALDLPGSVYSLILSRMDQLTENQQITMKVASVIGRLFQAAMVWGVYSKLGGEEKVKGSLEILRRSDITILDTPEPELTYLFKHIVTQQVAYNSLVYSTRAMLHNAIGSYIERVYSKTLDQYINLLAFHYENSENIDKKRVYLLMAGETAQRDYANLAAIEYYEKVLPLLALDDQVDVLLKLGEVLKLIGEWDRAGDRYNQALSLTEQLGDKKARAWVETAMGEFIWKQGHLEESTEWLLRARTGFEEMDELAGVGQVLHYMGVIADQQGDYEMAHNLMQESLTIRQKTGDQRQAAYLLGNMGIVARRQGNLEDARSLYEESLALRRELGDRWGIANVLNNLGNVTLDLEDHSKARSHLEEAVSIHRELGDRWAIGNALNNLANVYRTQGDYAAAKKMYDESLVIYGDLGDKWALAYLFEDVAWLEALQGNAQRAMCLVAAGSVLREQINAPLSPAETDKLMRVINPIRETLSVDEQSAATTMGREMAIEQAIDCALAASIS
jgi:tetratricopeptide (TPR) repeat protein